MKRTIPPSEHPKMSSSKTALALATWGGSGYFPVGPGTAGSIVAAAMAWGLVNGLGLAPSWLAACAAALFWPGVVASTAAARHFNRPDPPQVVVDEVIGQWLALSVASPGEWRDWLAAFALFRLFDIAKPFPIRRLERLPEGLGIMADDAAAGLCAMMILSGLHWLSLW
jgi:phosphatidylglycerophosphatase A